MVSALGNFMIRRCMTANSVPNFALALYVKFGVACRSSALHVEECVENSALYVPFGVVCATFGAVYQTLRAEFWRGGPSGARVRACARARVGVWACGRVGVCVCVCVCGILTRCLHRSYNDKQLSA